MLIAKIMLAIKICKNLYADAKSLFRRCCVSFEINFRKRLLRGNNKNFPPGKGWIKEVLFCPFQYLLQFDGRSIKFTEVTV